MNCIICGSSRVKRVGEEYFQYNSYSYFLSCWRGVDEKSLIKQLKPLYCEKCGVSYYEDWISVEENERIYVNEVPTHPTCKKISSTKYHYTEVYVHKLIEKIKDKVVDGDCAEISRYLREINSLLTSVGLDKIEQTNCDLINVDNLKTVRALLALCKVGSVENRLVSGSKYCGFRKGEYKSKIEEILNQELISDGDPAYAEAGCPVWGLLDDLSLRYKSYFITDLAENFWGLNSEIVGVDHVW